MAFTVRKFFSETDLQAVIGGTVTTFPDEATLDAGIAAAADPQLAIAKGLKYTLIDSPTLPNIQYILGHGAEFTLIDGTP